MTKSAFGPYKKGDPDAKRAGRKGGKVSVASKAAKKLTDEAKTLGALQSLGVLDFMDRFSMTGESWASWRMVAKILDGRALDEKEMVLYTELTGRSVVPKDPRTLWAIVGRRGGKSRFASTVAIHAATRLYPKLAAGEKARVLLLAANREQAEGLFDFIDGAFTNDPDLSRLVVNKTRTSLLLANRVLVQVTTSNFRAVRSFTAALVIADESAFWQTEDGAANPDQEVLKALRPTLATLRGRMLCVTTPFARRGAAWEAYSRYFAQDESESVLVLNGPTLKTNPTIDAKEIAQDEAEDPEHAAAEWHGQWRTDKEGYVRMEVLDAVTAQGVTERPPQPNVRYKAAVDVAGGSGKDSYTLSIGHVEGERWIQDVLREWKPPFSPGEVTAEACGICSVYGVRECMGDRYGGGFPPEEFARFGIKYLMAPRDASAYYIDALALLNTRRALLLDDVRLRRQFLGLRREHGGAGQTKVRHRDGQHDDLSNVTSLGMVEGLGLSPNKKRQYVLFGSDGRWWSNDPAHQQARESTLAQQDHARLVAHARSKLAQLEAGDRVRAQDEDDTNAPMTSAPTWFVHRPHDN